MADLLDRDAASALDVLMKKVADSGVLEDCSRMACDFCDRAGPPAGHRWFQMQARRIAGARVLC